MGDVYFNPGYECSMTFSTRIQVMFGPATGRTTELVGAAV